MINWEVRSSKENNRNEAAGGGYAVTPEIFSIQRIPMLG